MRHKAGWTALIAEGRPRWRLSEWDHHHGPGPQVRDAVDIPVTAAGGIADGRQPLAAYALVLAAHSWAPGPLVERGGPIHENPGRRP